MGALGALGGQEEAWVEAREAREEEGRRETRGSRRRICVSGASSRRWTRTRRVS